MLFYWLSVGKYLKLVTSQQCGRGKRVSESEASPVYRVSPGQPKPNRETVSRKTKKPNQTKKSVFCKVQGIIVSLTCAEVFM